MIGFEYKYKKPNWFDRTAEWFCVLWPLVWRLLLILAMLLVGWRLWSR